MFVSPQYVKFECPNDVIDYVTRGLPPTKEDFNNVMNKVKMPDDWQGAIDKQGKELAIPYTVFKDWNEEEVDVFCETLERVYANRVRNRNIACGVIGAAVITGVIIAIAS